MANKYVFNNGGLLTEKEGTTTSVGAGDGGKIVALDPSGRLDNSLMPIGVGTDTGSVLASENLSAGNFVNIYNDAGTAKCRKTDATTSGKEAHGFVLSSVNSGTNATVYFEGTNTAVTDATPGNVFLSTTAGGFTSIAPSASGNCVQCIGVAISPTAINFERGLPIILA